MYGPLQRRELTLRINGSPWTVQVEARRTLADVIRDECGLTGTHLGCEHGVCGACTVLVDGYPVRSCLGFAVQFAGTEITTVEGAAGDAVIAAVQETIVEERALQCGFCTPGYVMLLAGLVHMGWEGDETELTSVLSSNLCRCTGYQGLLRAARRLLGEGETDD